MESTTLPMPACGVQGSCRTSVSTPSTLPEPIVKLLGSHPWTQGYDPGFLKSANTFAAHRRPSSLLAHRVCLSTYGDSNLRSVAAIRLTWCAELRVTMACIHSSLRYLQTCPCIPIAGSLSRVTAYYKEYAWRHDPIMARKPLQISPLEPIRLPRVIKVDAEERVNSEQHWEFL
jgi:hypothetical protein